MDSTPPSRIPYTDSPPRQSGGALEIGLSPQQSGGALDIGGRRQLKKELSTATSWSEWSEYEVEVEVPAVEVKEEVPAGQPHGEDSDSDAGEEVESNHEISWRQDSWKMDADDSGSVAGEWNHSGWMSQRWNTWYDKWGGRRIDVGRRLDCMERQQLFKLHRHLVRGLRGSIGAG